MTELDLELPNEAAELIDEFGKEITYTRVIGSTYNPATGGVTNQQPPMTIKATVEPDTGQSVAFGLIERANYILNIAAVTLGFEPSTGDRIAWDGDDHIVSASKTYYSGELPVLYTVFVN